MRFIFARRRFIQITCIAGIALATACKSSDGGGDPPSEPFLSDKGTVGITSFENDVVAVADVMGSIGTNYLVQMVNWKIAVFDRNTPTLARVRQANLKQFFAVTNAADVYPKGFRIADPRIIYDHLSGRWIACGMDLVSGLTNNQVFLAISNGPDPVALGSAPSDTDTNWIAANWKKYVIDVALPNLRTDYPTLGVDANGIYIATHYVTNGTTDVVMQRIVALPKNALLSGTSATLQPVNSSNIFTFSLGPGEKAIQPALNFEASPPEGVAWFLSRGAPTNNRPGKILYGRLKWNPSTAIFEKQANWFDQNTGINAPAAISYWDIPDDSAGEFNAPQKGKGSNNTSVPLRKSFATHVMSAVVQNGHLWMCQHVGFNQDGGYSTNSPATRSGIVWYRFQVNSGSLPTLSHTATPTYGRLWDRGGSDPYWYYYPSLMANSQGDIVIGFSGSRSTKFIGAYYWGRKANGRESSRPMLIQAGQDYFHFSTGIRWGDYSATALDPDKGLFCTFQQFSAFEDPDVRSSMWGSYITTIKSP